MGTTIKLLVACRQQQYALDLCARLAQWLDPDLDAQATSMDEALRRAALTKPDVLLVEHTADGPDGACRVLSGIAQVSARTRVLLHCETYTQDSVIAFLQQGASGCILASSAPSLHAKAIRTVHEGGTWFGRTELLRALRSRMHADAGVTPDLPDEQALLTAREREILRLIGSALSNKEIGQQLRISEKTVKTHLHHIYVKLHQSGRYKAFLSNAAPGLR